MPDKPCSMSGECAFAGQCSEQSGAIKSCKRKFFNAGEITVGIALACYQAWVSMSFKSLNIFSLDTHGEQVLDTIYIVSIAVVLLTLIFVGIYDKAAKRVLENRISLYVLPAVMTLSTIGMTLSVLLSNEAALTLQVVVGIVSGISSGLLLVRFGREISRLDIRSCVAIATIGTVGSTAIFTLFLLFEAFPACVMAASMPVAAALLLQFGMHSLEDHGLIISEEAAAAEAEENFYDDAEWTALTIKLAVCCALIGFSNEVGRTLYMQMGIISIGGKGFALVEAGAGLAATVVLAAISLGLLAMHTPRTARNIYHTLILLLMISALALMVPVTIGYEHSLIPHAISTASYSCFSMFIWVALTGLCGRHPGKGTRMFAFVRAGWAAGPLVGLLLGRFVINSVGITSESVLALTFLSALAVLISSGFSFSETDLVRAMDLLPTQHKQRFREKCSRAAEKFRLSERETEVMVLLAKGRNLPYIQEQLFLSKSTVSTHRQHIYAKMDIHSQQELINLIQNETVN